MNVRPHRFWFHLNKPQTKKEGRPVWSLHYNGACHMVDEIECLGPTMTRANKRQPVAVVVGMTRGVSIYKHGDKTGALVYA